MALISISEQNGLNLLRNDDIKILSIGISTGGQAELKMLEGNPERYVVATTIDEEGLEYTKKLLRGNNRIEAKLEDVSSPMPYQDEFFDFIYARLVLHYLDDASLANALAELYRVLKKDGRIFVVVKSVDDFVRKRAGAVHFPETGLTRTPRPNGSVSFRRFHTQETIETALKTAGFEMVYTKEYKERLFSDFMRTNMNDEDASLIECLGVRK